MSAATLVCRLRHLAGRIVVAVAMASLCGPGLAAPVTVAEGDHMAFVRLVVPKKQIYVGELVPVQIKAYFRTDVGVRLYAPPAVRNDAFTTVDLTDPPAQGRELINGVPYFVATWSSAVVPIKNGDYTLAMELPATLEIRQQPKVTLNDLFGADPLDGPLFNNWAMRSFQTRVIEKSVLLKTAVTAIDVLPLPAAGRPADFSGAVGSFDLKAEVTPTNIAAGDPLTVTLSIQGEGNFDRVNSDGLSTDTQWKAYRPRGSFSSRDKIGLHGSKKFQQAVVPLQAGSVTLPALNFSYFDPQSRQYVVRHTQPIKVSVERRQNLAGNATPNAPNTAPGAGGRLPEGTPLAPIRLSMGQFTPTLRPLVQEGWFLILPGVPLVLMAGGLLFLKRHTRRASDLDRAGDAARSRVAALLGSMDDALRAGDGGAFMSAAHSALQVRLGQMWSLQPSAVSLAEVDARLDSSWDATREVFRLADQIAYGGVRPEVATLERWRQIIREQLQRAGQS
jgi:hypothetical protein